MYVRVYTKIAVFLLLELLLFTRNRNDCIRKKTNIIKNKKSYIYYKYLQLNSHKPSTKTATL